MTATSLELTFGFSPCPNDTFAFHALVEGMIDTPLKVRPMLLDIEELNLRARTGEFALTKLSVASLPAVANRYAVLRSGAALGYGCGPLVVAREPLSLARAASGRIAIPGRETTAYLLLRLLAPQVEQAEVVELRFDRILEAVAAGDVDAGLIIHESRFTYAGYGLVGVADLGELWETETSLPVPLATICARRDLEPAVRSEADRALRASVEYAFEHPDSSREFVRAHAQELSDEVCRQHIELYVNDFTVDLGEEGLAAISALTGRMPDAPTPPVAGAGSVPR
jgi:5,8-dihydroxy-2-naphthoate synthase